MGDIVSRNPFALRTKVFLEELLAELSYLHGFNDATENPGLRRWLKHYRDKIELFQLEQELE